MDFYLIKITSNNSPTYHIRNILLVQHIKLKITFYRIYYATRSEITVAILFVCVCHGCKELHIFCNKKFNSIDNMKCHFQQLGNENKTNEEHGIELFGYLDRRTYEVSVNK